MFFSPKSRKSVLHDAASQKAHILGYGGTIANTRTPNYRLCRHVRDMITPSEVDIFSENMTFYSIFSPKSRKLVLHDEVSQKAAIWAFGNTIVCMQTPN